MGICEDARATSVRPQSRAQDRVSSVARILQNPAAVRRESGRSARGDAHRRGSAPAGPAPALPAPSAAGVEADPALSFSIPGRIALTRAPRAPVCGGPGCTPGASPRDFAPRDLPVLSAKLGALGTRAREHRPSAQQRQQGQRSRRKARAPSPPPVMQEGTLAYSPIGPTGATSPLGTQVQARCEAQVQLLGETGICKLPGRLRLQPALWSREDVLHWLRWAEREYCLPRAREHRFQMDGRALCSLAKDDFRRRARGSGDVLYELLQYIKTQRRALVCQPFLPRACRRRMCPGLPQALEDLACQLLQPPGLPQPGLVASDDLIVQSLTAGPRAPLLPQEPQAPVVESKAATCCGTTCTSCSWTPGTSPSSAGKTGPPRSFESWIPVGSPDSGETKRTG